MCEIKTTQIPLLSAEIFEAMRQPPPPRKDLFQVMAFSVNRYWKIWPKIFLTCGEAEQYIRQISKRAWNNFHIVKIPGGGLT